nr:sulfatase-like hydrolase/transferase [uncultured Noviherbaspirillum sp.]
MMKIFSQIREMGYGRTIDPSRPVKITIPSRRDNPSHPFRLLNALIFGFVLCLASSYLLFDDFLLKRWLAGNTLARNFFVLLHLVSIYIYIFLCCLKPRWLPISISYGAMLAIDASFYRITSVPPSAIDYEVWLTAISDINNAGQLYFNEFIINLSKVALVGVVANLISRHAEIFLPTPKLKIFLVIIMIHSAGFFAALYYKGPEISAGLAPGSGLAQSSLLNLVDKALKAEHPAVVNLSITPATNIKTVILVIDESVTTKAFEELWKTADWKREDTWLFRAYSSANCSAASNFFIRYGVMDPKLAQNHKAGLSIMEKAKRSGYKVIYYDMQNVLGDGTGKRTSSRGNYFQPAELAAIDEIVARPQHEPYPDSWVANEIEKKYRAEKEKSFIVVNKAGAHFPYENRTFPKDRLPGESAYLSAIRINTMSFLKKLTELTRLNGDTVLFYTSDHGQNYRSRITHCSANGSAPDIEWEVPLVFIGDQLRNLMPSTRADRTLSHFHLTETLNNILGYDDPDIPNIMQGAATTKDNAVPHYGAYGSPFPIFNNPVQTKILGVNKISP